jgi:hypothetical protein
MQGTVLAANNIQEANWVLVGDSPLLDRSSKYLWKGNLKSGIKYAHKALARSQSEYASIIAIHNLCMAYTAQGEIALSSQYCVKVEQALMPEANLKEIKPGLYKIVRRKKTKLGVPTLGAVIVQNLESNRLNTESPHLARVN